MDVMLDLETLGTKPGSVILSIGAATFDGKWTFHRRLTLTDQLASGMTMDPATIDWWMNQSDAARQSLFGTTAQQDRTTAVVALMEFSRWCAEVDLKTVWGHGLNFDIPLLEALYRANKISPHWGYRAGRDTRTLFDLAGKKMGDFGTPNPLAHDALCDAVYQATETVKCREYITGGLRTAGLRW